MTTFHSKRVKCASGIMGYQCKLQDSYVDYESWEEHAELYGLHTRLGYNLPLAAWNANPTIQGSVIPDDFRVVKE